MKTTAIIAAMGLLWAGAAFATPVDVKIDNTDKLQRAGKMNEALAEAQGAMDLAKASKDELEVAKADINLGAMLIAVGQYKDAEAPLQGAMAIRERRLGKDDPATLDAISQYSGFLTFTGRDAEAEPLLAQAAEGQARTAKTPADRSSAGETRGGHGMVLMNLGRWSEGEAELRRSIAMLTEPGLPTSPAQPAFMSVLASGYLSWGRYADARDQGLATLAFREKYQGKDHPELAGTLAVIANAELQLGQAAEAEQHFRRALTIAEAGYPPESPLRAKAMQNLAGFYAATGRPDQADALYERSIAQLEKANQLTWAIGQAHLNYAQALLRRGDPAAARPHAETAVQVYEKSLGPANEGTGAAHLVLAQTLDRLGEADRARAEAETALKIYDKALTPENPRRGDVLLLQGRLVEHALNPAQSQALYEQALKVMAPARAASDGAVVEARLLLARRLMAGGAAAGGLDAVRPAAAALRDKALAQSRLLGRTGDAALDPADRQVFLTAVDAAWAASQ